MRTEEHGGQVGHLSFQRALFSVISVVLAMVVFAALLVPTTPTAASDDAFSLGSTAGGPGEATLTPAQSAGVQQWMDEQDGGLSVTAADVDAEAVEAIDVTDFDADDVDTQPRFEPNAGRFDDSVDLVLPAGDGQVTIGDGVVTIDGPDDGADDATTLTFVGADEDTPPALDDETGPITNFFIGDDPAEWVTNVRPAGAIEYSNLIGTTDVRFLAVEDGFRFDVQIEPGTEPSSVVVDTGDAALRILDDGRLEIGGDEEALTLSAPVAFQDTADGRVLVDVEFVLPSEQTFGFQVGEYDESLPLVIDPTLDLSTFIGGTNADRLFGAAATASGDVIVVGGTGSSDYVTTGGVYDTTLGGTDDIVVTKLSQDGSTVIWSTYVGGANFDEARSVEVAADGSIYVAGYTNSPDFPTTAGAYDSSLLGVNDAVVFQLSSLGTTLDASTYFGGNESDFSRRMTLDNAGDVVLGVNTGSVDFPATVGAYNTSKSGPSGEFDPAVAHLSGDLTTLNWATFLGGAGDDFLLDVGVDASDQIYALIDTTDAALATSPGAYDPTANGSNDLWLGRLDSTGSTLGYATYLGGSGVDGASGAIAVESLSRIHVAGSAAAGFPTTGNASFPTGSGADTAYAILDPTQTGTAQLIHGTFLGGTGNGFANDIAVDADGRAYIVGDFGSAGLATANATDSTLGGTYDAALTIIDPATGSRDFATYLGGSSIDIANAVLLDGVGDVTVVGTTGSTDFPTTAGAYQTTSGGSNDGFVARFGAIPAAVTPDPVVLDEVQSGTTTLPSGSTSVTVTIDAVDPARSFLTFGIRGNDGNPTNILVRGQLTDATTLTFQRWGTTDDVEIEWSVAEFVSGVTVQRGTTQLTASPTEDVAISAVDLSRSFPMVGMSVNGTVYGDNDNVRAELTSSTNLRLTLRGATNQNFVDWQVVTYNDSAVQSGTLSLGTADASATATVTAVDTTKAWLVYSADGDNGTANDIGQKLIRGQITDATTLTFDRSNTGQDMTISWHLIEFTDATTVQHASAAFPTSTTVVDVPINPVGAGRAIAVGGTRGFGGRTTYTADDHPGVAWFTTELTSATNLRVERALAPAPADLGWFVVEWPCDDADGDGLCDSEEDANADADNDPATNPGPDTDGDLTPNYLDADDDGDGVPTASENADPNGDGDPRDAVDSDGDGQADWLDPDVAGPSSTPVAGEQKISSTSGGFTGPLDNGDSFGSSVAAIGDIDGDGVADLAVGAWTDDDGGIDAGAVYILFLNADGSVRAEQKISDLVGGLAEDLVNFDYFGASVAGLGDVDGDGVNDIAVAAMLDDDGGTDRGAVLVLFLNADGTVRAEQKISSTAGGLPTTLADTDLFGSGVAGIGDLDGDGVNDLAVGALQDDGGGSDRGAVHVLFLNADGTVRSGQEISAGVGGFSGPLADGDAFGHEVRGIGDVDGDGIGDLAVGATADGAGDRGAVYVLFMNADGTVRTEQKIGDATGGFTGQLDDGDNFGKGIAGLGDIDGDGVPDIAVGAHLDDDGSGSNHGALYILTLGADGTVRSQRKISDTSGGLSAPIDPADDLGFALASLGDLDGDGAANLAVGALYDDDGGTDRGAVYVIDLTTPVDSDGDGLWDREEDANVDADNDPSTNPGPDTDGDLTPNYLDPDDDGDGVPTASENADPNGDGDPRDAVDSDRDGEPDYLDVEAGPSSTPIADEQKISSTQGGMTGPLESNDRFGVSVAGVGDIDGDGVNDVVVGAREDDDGGSNRGAVYVLFLNADGTVRAEQKISSSVGGLTGPLGDSDNFGISVAGVGDVDGDGVNDIAVGAAEDDDGGIDRGAVYVLFLNANGTVRAERKISSSQGGLTGPLDDVDSFGDSVGSIGDLDGDGVNDLVVGALRDDDGGPNRGAAYVLFLNADGSVKAEQKISSTQGGLSGPLDNTDTFGNAVSGLGDVDGDGVNDIVVGARLDDDGGTSRGSVYLLFLNADGTVRSEQKISDSLGGLAAPLDDLDFFGSSISGVGDIDGDGVNDIAVGARQDDDGGTDRGAVYLLSLNADGTVRSEQKISSTRGRLTGPLADDDSLGVAVAGLGDLDGDGAANLIVGAHLDDDGGSASGAVYVVDLTALVDSDGDGLWDHEEDANVDADNDPSTNPGPDTDGDLTPNYLDPDDDGDGVPTASENADPNADGDPRDALDSDVDAQPDYLDVAAGASSTPVIDEQKISDTQGGFNAILEDSDEFGRSVTSIGDLDGDGIMDLAVGGYRDDDGGSDRGAVYILFMNTDGTVRAEQKISDTVGGLTEALADGDQFGVAVAGVGDLDGDGRSELAVGVRRDDDGDIDAGSVIILWLETDGTVAREQKISDTDGGFTAALAAGDNFGAAVAGLGDLDGDGIPDIAVGAYLRETVDVLFLNPDGTVKAEQRIGRGLGGLAPAVGEAQRFGVSIARVGDVDGDDVADIVVGTWSDDDGGTDRGGVYVLFMNTDGTISGDQKISSTSGGLTTPLANGDRFGSSVAGLGDLDRDGTPDVAVGSRFADSGGSVLLLSLASDGTVLAEQNISSGVGGKAALAAGDQFGASLAGLGDFDGDGGLDIAVGAHLDDDGGTDRGAIHLLDLSRYQLPIEVNSTGDASDATPGDRICDTGGVNAIGQDECTLRAAIEEANAFGAATISFAVPGADGGENAGVWTTAPASPYDDISALVTIDGSTQPGWVLTPVFQIDGSGAGVVDGLRLVTGAEGSTIRSLAITGFDENAIDITADNTRIVGNHLAIDAAGANSVLGVGPTVLVDGAANTVIGGSTAGDRNLIGTDDAGVLVDNGATDTVVSGNWISIDITGNARVPSSGDGVRVEGSSVRTVIGGPTAADGNLISLAGLQSIEIIGVLTDDTTVQHNVFGLGVDGTTSLFAGSNAVFMSSATNVLIEDNIIANTVADGIWASGASDVDIRSNTFGTDVGLTTNQDLGRAAVRVTNGAQRVRIGGVSPGDGNHFAQGRVGSASIEVDDALTDDVSILGNTIVNDFGAIDLGADGPTANDAGDVDGGANDLINHPTLAITNTTGAGPFNVDLDVTLDTVAGDYRIEIYANSERAFGGAGKAEQLVHAFDVTHTGSGAETFATSYTDTSFSYLSATSTESFGGGAYGSTSEMSPPAAPVNPVFVVNSTADTGDDDLTDDLCLTGATNADTDPECTFRAALDQANRLSGATIEFAIPDADGGLDPDGFWRITQTTDWPRILSTGLTIDGSTQPTFDGSRPVILLEDNGSGLDALDLAADDINVAHLAVTRAGDDGVQIQGSRITVDDVWLGIEPNGTVIESPGASREGIIVYDGSTDAVVTNSRVAGFDSGIISNSGTIEATFENNEIFGNRNGGVVFGNSGRFTLLGNSIYDNDGLGFELGLSDGTPRPNDIGDGDTGPNNYLNHPVLTSATVGAGTVDLDYTLDVPAGTYRIEFFDSDRPDPTGFGEGQTFLAAATIVHPGGSVSYSATVPGGLGDVFTATATPDLGGGTYGGTSEFSNASQVGIVFVNSTGDANDLTTADGLCDTGALTADGAPECTLRAAIEQANASADLDIIHFQIPETDPGFVAGPVDHWTITPATTLGFSSDITSLDATTQPGWVDQPIIELDGSSVVAGVDRNGFLLANGMTLRGLSITNWLDFGVLAGSTGATLTASWLGVSPDGSVASNNGDFIAFGSATGLVIGGPTPAEGNLFAAGGSLDGVIIANTSSNVLVENNRFGVTPDGLSDLGSTAAEQVSVANDASGVVIRGNQFGGSPNAAVVVVDNAGDVDIVDNVFGTDATSTATMPNAQALYTSTSGDVRFGGIGAGEGNLVRNAVFDAILVGSAQTGAVTVLGNSISGSGQLALDLRDDEVTGNDAGDGDTGPNGLLNFPEILDAIGSGGFVNVRFQLDVPAGDYRIEAFANPSGADPSGHGEGEIFAGSLTVTHSGAGNQVFEMGVVAPAGAPLSLTATEDLGGGVFGATSEFGPNLTPTVPVIVEDISTRRTDLSAAGGLDPAVPAVGVAGNGINVDGGGERLVGPPTDITSGELTVAAWIELDSFGTEPRVVSKGVGASVVYELFIDDATAEAVARFDLGGVIREVRGGTISTGTFHQVVATWDGSTMVLFVDGVVVDSILAAGGLSVDLDEPLIIGNNQSGSAGLDGTIDQVEIQHRAMSAVEILARSRNGNAPSLYVSIGAEQTEAPSPWTTSAVQARTGGNALAAPTTNPGADAWITAIGVDEPGVEVTAWWWVSDANSSEVAAGTRTGPNATDQFDASASGAGLDLGVIAGAVRSSVDTEPTTLSSGSWQQVVMSTDELGVTSFTLDGVLRLGPSTLSGEPSGSFGFRAADIEPGQQWFIDDVLARRLVSDEPTTSLGPIERN